MFCLIATFVRTVCTVPSMHSVPGGEPPTGEGHVGVVVAGAVEDAHGDIEAGGEGGTGGVAGGGGGGGGGSGGSGGGGGALGFGRAVEEALAEGGEGCVACGAEQRIVRKRVEWTPSPAEVWVHVDQGLDGDGVVSQKC